MEKQSPTMDSAKLAESNAEGVRAVTWTGLWINVVLTLAKLVAGILAGSRALVADSIHSLSDFSTDLAVIVGSHFWSQPPDADHPYGHRRIETLVSIAIGIALASVGVFLVIDAVSSLRSGSVSHPGWLAAVVAVVSIISKEWLYRYTLAKGRELKSSAVMANAWHHRSDAVSSLPVLVAVVLARLFPGLSFIDALGAIVVAAFILQAAYAIAWPGITEMIDRGASLEIHRDLEQKALTVTGVHSVHELRTRFAGSALYVDLHVVLAPEMRLDEAHAIGDRVRDALLLADHNVVDVLVHLDPGDDRVAVSDNNG